MISNLDIHTFRTREGKWSSRTTGLLEGRALYVTPVGSFQEVMVVTAMAITAVEAGHLDPGTDSALASWRGPAPATPPD